MLSGLLVSVTSGLVLCVLTILFRVEEARGSRLLLSGLRTQLDRLVLTVELLCMRVTHFVNARVIRVTFHYIVHSVLGYLIALLHRVQGRLARLQVKNRYLVKAVKKTHSVESHLEKLASFKEETALSEKEKRKRREH